MIYAIINMDNQVQKSTTVKQIAENWINEGYTVSILEVTRYEDTVKDLEG